MTEPKTKVIFRVWSDFTGHGRRAESYSNQVIAIFPQEAGAMSLDTCLSYMHVGQHSACGPQGLTQQLRLATPKEYRPLARELRRIGYRLDIRRRITRQDLEIRRSQIHA